MNKKNKYGIHAGSSSLLFIFIIVSLVSFAALSIVSAQADYRLSEKVGERTHAYYDACNKAQESLAIINTSLSLIYKDEPDRTAYFAAAGHEISFAVPVTGQQFIEITAETLYPDTPEGPYYLLKKWQVTNTGAFEYKGSHEGITIQ